MLWNQQPQPNVTEESPSRVEGDVIEEGRLIIEELLSARTRCRAPRAGTPVQDPADTEQRGRIVEILWKEIERSGIRKCDRLWRRDVMREHDALGIARDGLGRRPERGVPLRVHRVLVQRDRQLDEEIREVARRGGPRSGGRRVGHRPPI